MNAPKPATLVRSARSSWLRLVLLASCVLEARAGLAQCVVNHAILVNDAVIQYCGSQLTVQKAKSQLTFKLKAPVDELFSSADGDFIYARSGTRLGFLYGSKVEYVINIPNLRQAAMGIDGNPIYLVSDDGDSTLFVLSQVHQIRKYAIQAGELASFVQLSETKFLLCAQDGVLMELDLGANKLTNVCQIDSAGELFIEPQGQVKAISNQGSLYQISKQACIKVGQANSDTTLVGASSHGRLMFVAE
jgi:hypothetical protein